MKYIVSKDYPLKSDDKVINIYKEYGKCVEIIDERELINSTEKIQFDYSIRLGEVNLCKIKYSNDILYATIGNKIDDNVAYYYDFSKDEWSKSSLCDEDKLPIISCYSNEKDIPVSYYLQCIHNLDMLASSLNRRLVIIGNVEPALPYYKDDSLANSIISSYIKNGTTKYYMQTISNSNDSQEIVYVGTDSEKLKEYISQDMINCKNTRDGLLYDDPFYRRIPDNQKIYIPIKINNAIISTIAELGINTITIGNNIILIYDTKENIDNAADSIRGMVESHYMQQIVTPAPITKRSGRYTKYSLKPQNISYDGSNIYIGIITTEDIDYTDPLFIDENGSRIDYLWTQNEAEDGTLYTKDDIDKMIERRNTGNNDETLPINSELTDSDIVLTLAGGRSSTYEGVAPNARFIISKINSAPESLSRIYGGGTNDKAVLMPDVIIGLYTIINITNSLSRPVVVYIPYNTNLSFHDGTNTYDLILGNVSRLSGVSIVVPMGEEGDKMHHERLLDEQGNTVPEVNINIAQNSQSVVGMIYMRYIDKNIQFRLTPPNGTEQVYRLDLPGEGQLYGATIYTTGIVEAFNNGGKYILFSISNASTGAWNIKWEVQTYGVIKMWLAQQQLNRYSTLSPNSSFSTLGSLAANTLLFSVGSFNIQDRIMPVSVGRPYSWDIIYPPICLQDYGLAVQNRNSYYNVEGTAVSSAATVGLIALLYEKWEKEIGRPFPNTLIMINAIIAYLRKKPLANSPTSLQEYGVIGVQNFNRVINEVFV